MLHPPALRDGGLYPKNCFIQHYALLRFAPLRAPFHSALRYAPLRCAPKRSLSLTSLRSACWLSTPFSRYVGRSPHTRGRSFGSFPPPHASATLQRFGCSSRVFCARAPTSSASPPFFVFAPLRSASHQGGACVYHVGLDVPFPRCTRGRSLYPAHRLLSAQSGAIGPERLYYRRMIVIYTTKSHLNAI